VKLADQGKERQAKGDMKQRLECQLGSGSGSAWTSSGSRMHVVEISRPSKLGCSCPACSHFADEAGKQDPDGTATVAILDAFRFWDVSYSVLSSTTSTRMSRQERGLPPDVKPTFTTTHLDGSRRLPPDPIVGISVFKRSVRQRLIQEGDVDLPDVSKRAVAVKSSKLTTWLTNTIPSRNDVEPITMD
jgi:hypothetical protein